MRRSRLAGFLALVAAPALACGDGSPAGDAGDTANPDDGEAGDAPEPSPPDPPVFTPCPAGWVELPTEEPDGVTTCDPWPSGGPAVLTPCPAGWREVADPEGGTVTCDPWPETGREECAAMDEEHFPGEPGCTRIGTACLPDDPWATDLPGDRPIRFVLAGATAGGEGTRTSPFGTIGEATADAPPGTIVALSKGTFDEVVVLPEGVTLWGACVAETLVASEAPSEVEGTINVSGADTAVWNLRVGGRRAGLRGGTDLRDVALRDVLVERAGVYGIVVGEGAFLSANGLVVRDTRSLGEDWPFGIAVVATDGAVVEIRRAVLSRNVDVAISAVDPDTRVTLEDVAVLDTQPDASTDSGGGGIGVRAGARVEARRVAFERNRGIGLYVSGPGTSVVLEDVVVRDTLERASDGAAGRGLYVCRGAAVDVRRGLLERNREIAVTVEGAGSRLSLTDVVVRDTRSSAAGGIAGDAVGVLGGATAEIVRAALERNLRCAVGVSGAGSSVALRDIVVRDTGSQESDRMFGRGLDLGAGTVGDLRRVLFDGNRDFAVLAGGPATRLTLEDAVLRDTRSREIDRWFGRGLHLQRGVTAAIRRALFERNREYAVIATDVGTTVTIEDAVVRDTMSQEASGLFGLGMVLRLGAVADLKRTLFQRNRGVAVAAYDPGTHLTMEDGAVIDTLPLERGDLYGHGMGAYGGGRIEVARFRIAGNALCGIQLAHGVDLYTGARNETGGTADLADGVVAHNAVCGANVQTDGFDLRRLQNDVRWYDNGTDLDVRELPVPGLDSSIP
jgi:hypothetical protein